MKTVRGEEKAAFDADFVDVLSSQAFEKLVNGTIALFGCGAEEKAVVLCGPATT